MEYMIGTNINLWSSILKTGGGGVTPWTPAALFATSEEGGWYDPSDLSTLWQDTAGTTQVTATGQVVARIDDKSGNGNHATQTTEGLRPILRQDLNDNYYLDFSDVDDELIAATPDLGSDATIAGAFAPKT